jgi:hypothetical protein
VEENHFDEVVVVAFGDFTVGVPQDVVKGYFVAQDFSHFLQLSARRRFDVVVAAVVERRSESLGASAKTALKNGKWGCCVLLSGLNPRRRDHAFDDYVHRDVVGGDVGVAVHSSDYPFAHGHHEPHRSVEVVDPSGDGLGHRRNHYSHNRNAQGKRKTTHRRTAGRPPQALSLRTNH